uniref:Uncharacterized protein n=1 Tax=Oryza punctata TaxID=4537 RepID=A0A0E0M3N3_ORYPU
MTRYSAGMDSGNHGTTRTESKTLYVEGLPLNCTKRGCTYSSPLSGFFEVRLVNKESRYAGRYIISCVLLILQLLLKLVLLWRLQRNYNIIFTYEVYDCLHPYAFTYAANFFS